MVEAERAAKSGKKGKAKKAKKGKKGKKGKEGKGKGKKKKDPTVWLQSPYHHHPPPHAPCAPGLRFDIYCCICMPALKRNSSVITLE